MSAQNDKYVWSQSILLTPMLSGKSNNYVSEIYVPQLLTSVAQEFQADECNALTCVFKNVFINIFGRNFGLDTLRNLDAYWNLSELELGLKCNASVFCKTSFRKLMW